MIFKRVYCLFEKSGTFKMAFKNAGFQAFDVDIEKSPDVDFQLDIFDELEKWRDGKKSFFWKLKKDDLIFAFFPCTYFSGRKIFDYKQNSLRYKDLNVSIKLNNNLNEIISLKYYYQMFSLLFLRCYEVGIQLIVENPYSSCNYLTRYFPLDPNLIDLDRRDMGDFFKKPTQYWFLNCKPNDNLIFLPIYECQYKRVVDNVSVENRSLISPLYARNFIDRYILEPNVYKQKLLNKKV